MCVLSVCSCAERFPKCSSKSAASAASLSCSVLSSVLTRPQTCPPRVHFTAAAALLSNHTFVLSAGWKPPGGVCFIMEKTHTHTHSVDRFVCVMTSSVTSTVLRIRASFSQDRPTGTYWPLLRYISVQISLLRSRVLGDTVLLLLLLQKLPSLLLRLPTVRQSSSN